MTIDLTTIARDLGVTIEYAPLVENGRCRDGEYRADLRRIRLRHGMPWRKERSALAHEIAHAMSRDIPTGCRIADARAEHRADVWAARELITADDYRRAEMLHGGSASAIALELNVTTNLVRAYRSELLRVGSAVYMRPRMGRGGWALRLDVA